MLERLEARGEEAANAAVRTAIERLAIEADLPADVVIATLDDGLILTGRALRQRMLADPRLRSIRR